MSARKHYVSEYGDAGKGQRWPLMFIRYTGALVACPGDAHKPEVGGMIDNCMICAPRWGKVEETIPPTLQDVFDGYAVPVYRTDAKRSEWQQAEQEGKIKMVGVRDRSSSFFAYVPTPATQRRENVKKRAPEKKI